jgi:hypothetical protein
VSRELVVCLRPDGSRGNPSGVTAFAVARVHGQCRVAMLAVCERVQRRLDGSQRAGRDDQRSLQSRVRLRPRPTAGTTSTSSSSRPCRGCTGSMGHGCTGTATTSRQRSTKKRSTLPNGPTPLGLESNRTSLHQPKGGSVASNPYGLSWLCVTMGNPTEGGDAGVRRGYCRSYRART